MKKYILCFLGITCFLFAQDKHQENIQKQKADPDPERFHEEIGMFRQLDNKNYFPTDAVLFVGSSSIRFWQTAKYFPEFPVINRGFGGSHISDINYFIELLVLKHKPRVIVFYAGDNDVTAGKDVNQVYGDYLEFVQTVKINLPESQIVYIPIKPSLARWSLWDVMNKTNNKIREYSENDDLLYYVDLATPMLNDEGTPDSSLFVSDGLHLNENGYELWTSILLPVLEKAFYEVQPKN